MTRRFDRTDEGIGLQTSSERLRAFYEALWKALVPRSRDPVSIQGELVRVVTWLRGDFLKEGMDNYYGDESDERLEDMPLGPTVIVMLDTLVENRNRALDDEDVAYFTAVRRVVHSDWLVGNRRLELSCKENGDEASEAETKELRELEAAGGGMVWDEVLNRAERCIANWCIANPKLVDRKGRPVEEGGIREVNTIFEPPPAPPPPCPICKGKGWLPPRDATQFPEVCSCKREQAQPA